MLISNYAAGSIRLVQQLPLTLNSHSHCIGIRQLHWPASPNPTPYQIFGLDPNGGVIDKKRIRAIYFELAKMYHPDQGTTGNAEKFKKVVEAHNILKDDSKRRSYDLSQAYAGSFSRAPQYHRQQHNPFQDDAEYSYWSNQAQEKFTQDLHESKVWVLKFVATITITVALINMAMLKDASQARAEAITLETDRIAAQLAYSSANYGKGANAQQRIERFLNDRQRMLDRFDQEISWEKFKFGTSRTSPKSAKNDEHTPKDQAEGPEPEKPSQIGKPQMKHHTGPVAEYFGRN